MKTALKIYKRNEHNLSRRSIDSDALKIMERLSHSGYKAYLVGGGVRDLLLQRTPKDFDIATDATPKEIKKLFGNCRIIGKRFKLAHIFFRSGKIIEVSTFRDNQPQSTESNILENDNYYGTEQTDAIRRDITINALFYNSSNFTIRDYVGGVEDLRSKLIKVIGDPLLRFTEDPVRMLRVTRHAVKAGFNIAPDALTAIATKSDLLLKCPVSRLYEEFKKDLSSGYFSGIVDLWHQTGMLAHLAPELEKLLENESGRKLLNAIDDWKLANLTPAYAAMYLICVLDGNFEEVSKKTFDDIKFLKNLAFPKREKENMQAALYLAQKLLSNRIKLGEAKKRKNFEDAEILIDLYNIYQENDEKLD